MFATLRAALSFGVLMTLLLGFVYPVFVWAGGRVFFADKAGGSLLEARGKIVGSALIGQNFTQERYFHGRPSATPRVPYNAQSSGASHLNPAHPVFLKEIAARAQSFGGVAVPVDLVTASGSGLDPHISVPSARFQVPRIAKARKITQAQVYALIDVVQENPTFGFLGQARVNVLLLNLGLDRL